MIDLKADETVLVNGLAAAELAIAKWMHATGQGGNRMTNREHADACCALLRGLVFSAILENEEVGAAMDQVEAAGGNWLLLEVASVGVVYFYASRSFRVHKGCSFHVLPGEEAATVLRQEMADRPDVRCVLSVGWEMAVKGR